MEFSSIQVADLQYDRFKIFVKQRDVASFLPPPKGSVFRTSYKCNVMQGLCFNELVNFCEPRTMGSL